jgi:lipid-binding SYLF domain-containing protein
VKRVTLLLLIVVLSSAVCLAAESAQKLEERLRNASEVLQQIMSAPDKSIPEEVVKGATCIAVIPHEIKGGFVVGARYGRGVATCRTADGGWSAPAFFTITGGTWGAQIGIEGVDNVLMIMNQKGMDRLLSNKFTVGADASAAAGPIGRHAAAAGVTLNGAVVRPDGDAMQAFYSGSATVHDVLLGRVPPPPAAKTFLAAVRDTELQASKQARE